MLAKQPAVHAQSISIIQELHSAPYFSRDLKRFLNSLLPRGQAIPHAQLQYADLGLGLDQLDVWHSYKLQMDDLGNDVDGEEGKETIKAKPGEKGKFDMVVVAHSAAAETTGLQGGVTPIMFGLICLVYFSRNEGGAPAHYFQVAYHHIAFRSTE